MVSGSPTSEYSLPRPVRARARLRPKSQLTLPEEIRRALQVSEGDEIEFRVDGDGTISVRGYVSVPADHAWLYAPRQITQRAPDPGLSSSQAGVHDSADALFAYLDTLGTAGG
jgi:AbrB family looped-hinge helix DNA binding protein